MSDEKAHHKKKADKAKGETRSQTQKDSKKEMSDEEAHRKKEAKKVKVEIWGQTQEIIEKEMFDEEAHRKKEAEGEYQQIKPVLRYPCDACKHVSKTTDQLKKHMIIAHNGHKNTTWMFCGDCEYATRVKEELVNHFLKKEAEKAKKEIEMVKADEEELEDKEKETETETEKKVIEKEMSDEKAAEDEEKLEEKEKETEGDKAKKEIEKKKVRKANHSESSDEGGTKFTFQARAKVPMLEKGMTYAEYKISVDMRGNAMKGHMSEKNIGMMLFQSPSNKDEVGCKDGVTNFRQFLDKKLMKTDAVKSVELNGKQIADMECSVPAPMKCGTFI